MILLYTFFHPNTELKSTGVVCKTSRKKIDYVSQRDFSLY